MPRFAITAIVLSSRWKIDLLCRRLKKELRKPSNAQWMELEDLRVVEMDE